MSEQGPVYIVARDDDAGQSLIEVVLPTPLPPLLHIYLERQREALIVQLRALDRVLGRPQTIPERQR